MPPTDQELYEEAHRVLEWWKLHQYDFIPGTHEPQYTAPPLTVQLAQRLLAGVEEDDATLSR